MTSEITTVSGEMARVQPRTVDVDGDSASLKIIRTLCYRDRVDIYYVNLRKKKYTNLAIKAFKFYG